MSFVQEALGSTEPRDSVERDPAYIDARRSVENGQMLTLTQFVALDDLGVDIDDFYYRYGGAA